MSISFLEIKKILASDKKFNQEIKVKSYDYFYKNPRKWINLFNYESLNKLMIKLRKEKISKEILDDFKDILINELEFDVNCFIEIGIIEEKFKVSFIKNLIFFGNFDIETILNKKFVFFNNYFNDFTPGIKSFLGTIELLSNETYTIKNCGFNVQDYIGPSYIFIFEKIIMLLNVEKDPLYFLRYLMDNDYAGLIFFVTNYWLAYPEENKEVIKDFKKIVRLENNFISQLIEICYAPPYPSDRFIFNKEYVFHLILNLLDFNIYVSDKDVKDLRERNRVYIDLEYKMSRLVAGNKIVKYIENAMDDEFEMKPLRTKIDLRKFKEIK
jgi:hypothetical protein